MTYIFVVDDLGFGQMTQDFGATVKLFKDSNLGYIRRRADCFLSRARALRFLDFDVGIQDSHVAATP